ncbi:hypothetical protein [Rhizobium leguminosarum]|uniref:hypothetical protein n=1 Tax=Rhizobium leguminosarum TaxID=384 RepID=UPI003F95E017
MHIAAFTRHKKKWYFVVFDGATSDTYYGTLKDAEDELKKLKRLKQERTDREKEIAEEYEEDFDSPLPPNFSIFKKVLRGELHVLLVGPVGFILAFRGPRALIEARSRAWRSLETGLGPSNDFDV